MDAFAKYLNIALKFLASRPRSEKEISDNLKKKKAPDEIIKQVIVKLKEKKFLNDQEFATWWIEQRQRFRQKSLRIIKLELRQKGISADILESVMNQEEGVKHDTENARQLVERQFGKYKHLEKRELYQKLGAFLARKGFDWDTIKESIDEVYKEEYNSN